MTRWIGMGLFAAALTLGGCSNEEISPGPNEIMTAPELSHPREARKTAEPPPPQREEIKKTQSALITKDDTAPVATTAETLPPPNVSPPTVEPGTVSPLR
jgi:hypothetical protein